MPEKIYNATYAQTRNDLPTRTLIQTTHTLDKAAGADCGRMSNRIVGYSGRLA